MKNHPSTCSLFHELFATEWSKDDPEFEEEIKHYETAIKRLLAVDSQLTTFIKTQPVMDYDQLSSVPVVSSTEKTVISSSVDPSKSGSGFDYQISSTDAPLFSIFSKIEVCCGQSIQVFKNIQNIDSIDDTVRNPTSNSIQIKCYWSQPLVQLTPPLAKFMQQPVAIPGLVSLKLLSHIDNKHMNQNGEIKCDAVLKSIFNADTIKMDEFGKLVMDQTHPIDPLIFELPLPTSRQEICVQYPVMSNDNAGQFRPINVEQASVNELFEECIKSKQQIEAVNAFLRNPYEFTENEVLLRARETDIPELYTSTFLYDQPWAVQASEEYLKTLLYNVSPKKK